MKDGEASEDPLASALAWLTEASGATLERVQQVDALLDLPAVTGRGDSADADWLLDVLYSAAHRLKGSQAKGLISNELVMLAALALGEFRGQKGGLHERLVALGKRAGGRELPTVRGYKRNVTPLFVEALRDLQPDQVVRRPVSVGDEAAPTPFREMLTDIKWTFAGRVPIRQLATRRLRVMTRDVTFYKAFLTYPNDQREEAIRAVAIANCEVTNVAMQSTGQHEIELRIPSTQPGEEVEFTYEIQVHSDAADRPYLRHLTRYLSDQASLSILFDSGQTPESVFTFEGKSEDYDPAQHDQRTKTSPNEVAAVSKTFEQKLGTRFGFTWTWPQARA